MIPVADDAPPADPPVLTMVAAFSGFIMALLLPSRTTGDLVAGMWQLLSGLGAVPKTLVWDNESGIGQRRRLTVGARSFAGTLGTRIHQVPPRDPESKGVIERANGFFETSFMPGRTFTGPADYNTQLAAWLPRANSQLLRRTGQQPRIRIDAGRAAMGMLPPVAPTTGLAARVRLGRDYYVRTAGNDYWVDPSVIGRFVDVHVGLTVITDPAHVGPAKRLRDDLPGADCRDMRGPVAAAGAVVGLRALSDYDEIFSLTPPEAAPVTETVGGSPDLEVVR